MFGSIGRICAKLLTAAVVGIVAGGMLVSFAGDTLEASKRVFSAIGVCHLHFDETPHGQQPNLLFLLSYA